MMDYQKGYDELELAAMVEKAENAVAVATGAAGLTGVVPIPFADAPMLIGEQVALMTSICAIFKINIKKDGLKALALAAIGAGGATVVGKTIATNLFKLVPGAGSLVGGAISAGTAGVVTLAMGKAFIEVCKGIKMGALSEYDLTSSRGKSFFKEQFKEQLRKAKISKNK